MTEFMPFPQNEGPLLSSSTPSLSTPRNRPRSLLSDEALVPRSMPATVQNLLEEDRRKSIVQYPSHEVAELQESLSHYSLLPTEPIEVEWSMANAIASSRNASQRNSLLLAATSPKSQPVTPSVSTVDSDPFDLAVSKLDGEGNAHSRSWSDPTILLSASHPQPDEKDREQVWKEDPEIEMEYDYEKEFRALGLG